MYIHSHVHSLSLKFLFLTAGLDYLSLSQEVTFVPGGLARQCVSVAIVNDAVLESNEVFSVSVATSDPQVLSQTPPSVVTISDSNGRFISILNCLKCSGRLKHDSDYWGLNELHFSIAFLQSLLSR